jgi:hypothetical protein
MIYEKLLGVDSETCEGDVFADAGFIQFQHREGLSNRQSQTYTENLI